MSALNDFVVAAGSYFGLPEGRVMQGSTLDVDMGTMSLVLRIELTTDDVVGIGKRMGVMMVEAKVDEVQALAKHFKVEPAPTHDQLRELYNQLPPAQRSAFGSFHNYVKACDAADPWTAGQSPVEGPLDLPLHVYVPGSELTAQQLHLALGMDEKGHYAMDPADLTKEQLEDYGPRAKRSET